MKLIDNITNKIYDKYFSKRCEIRPGIRYFDETHFDGLKKDYYEFKNSNGFTLRGGIYHYDNYNKDTLIIFCHGMGGGHQAYMKEINYIAQHNYQVLAIDYQGTILSDGDSLGGLSQPLKDMNDLLTSIKDNYKNIYVIGHSWGGYVSQGLAYLHPEIKKVCLISPVSSGKNLIDQYYPWYYSFLKKPLMKLEYEKFKELSLTSAEISLNRPDLKALVIQSEDDKVLNIKFHMDRIYKANINEKVEFYRVNGKNHNPTYTYNAVKILSNYLHELKKTEYLDEQRLLEEDANWDSMCELDDRVMKRIIGLFDED